MNNKIQTIFYGKKRNNIIGNIFLCIFIFLGFLISFSLNIYFVLLFVLSALLLLIAFLINDKNKKKFIKSLTKTQLFNIEKEATNPLIYCEYNYVLTDNYIININIPYALLGYKDILMMYKETKLTLHSVDNYLILVTKKRKYKFLISTTLLTINYRPVDFSFIIKQKNPNVLVGKTDDNIQILKEQYNIDINNH